VAHQHISGPSLPELTARFVVLLLLVLRAAGVYLRLILAARGLWPATDAALVALQRRFAQRFVAVAVHYKGGLIKLGQVASLRVDVLPEEVSDELARLQDRVEPHGYGEIAAQIEGELGAPPERLFARFDAEPIAAASLGQVHAAWLSSGEKLAVKVLYPGVERSVAVDLAATRVGLWLFDFLTVADLRQVYRELRSALLGEMDYEREGRAAEEVARNLAQNPALATHIRVPAIHWPLTRRRVLSMEFIPGVKINDRAALAAQGRALPELALWATRAFLHMIFRDGFFHCDPHPGNLLVDPQGRVGIVDFGMNKRLTPQVMEMMRENVMATVTRDPQRYARSLLGAGMIQAPDQATVEEIAKIFFDPAYYNLTPRELSELDFGAYFRRMRVQLKRVRSFHLPDGIVMWSRALTLLLGLSTELAPGVRPLDVVGPYLMEFLQEGPEPGRSGKRPKAPPLAE